MLYISSETYGDDFKVRCYLRYYPEGFEVNPDNYYESGISEPVYYKNGEVYSGVNLTENDSFFASQANVTYNLMGQRVDPTTARPGIYIHNAKKMLIK